MALFPGVGVAMRESWKLGPGGWAVRWDPQQLGRARPQAQPKGRKRLGAEKPHWPLPNTAPKYAVLENRSTSIAFCTHLVEAGTEQILCTTEAADGCEQVWEGPGLGYHCP